MQAQSFYTVVISHTVTFLTVWLNSQNKPAESKFSFFARLRLLFFSKFIKANQSNEQEPTACSLLRTNLVFTRAQTLPKILYVKFHHVNLWMRNRIPRQNVHVFEIRTLGLKSSVLWRYFPLLSMIWVRSVHNLVMTRDFPVTSCRTCYKSYGVAVGVCGRIHVTRSTHVVRLISI